MPSCTSNIPPPAGAGPRPEDHLDLVYQVAASLTRRRVLAYDELVQEGSFGLLRAIRRYDPSRGPFAPFALQLIRYNCLGAIREHLRKMQLNADPVRLDAERVSDDPSHEVQQINADLAETVLKALSPRLRRVVRLRFGLGNVERPLNLREIGEKLGVSRQRVDQLYQRAMHYLREAASEMVQEEADEDERRAA